MNKSELIDAIAEKSGLNKKDTGAALDALLDTVKETLQNGGDVRLAGFGNFSVTARAESKGRNPSTGQEITIPASKRPKFTAGKALKEAVNV